MRLIGLMSGTSVDSIDAACVEIAGGPVGYSISLHKYVSCPWDTALKSAILESCDANTPLQRITALNFLVGEAFAEAAVYAAAEAHWELAEVDAIASHGQTIWHQPDPFTLAGTSLASVGTMQIGEPSVIAALTGCTVVADFRVADMAVGGQGAPLVPFADFVLFSNPQETRAIQNIGGIGNATFLRAGGRLDDVLAFDTGPGNMLIDGIARLTTGKEYDVNGDMAAAGEVCRPLLVRWLSHPFFSKKPPRTTGREMFGSFAAQQLLQEGRELSLSNADILASITALTTESIARSYREFLAPISRIDCVVLGGGGTHNTTLVSMLKQALAPARVTDHDEFGIDGDAKEALAFALLAYETLHGRPSNVPSATGARVPAVLGKVVRTYTTPNPSVLSPDPVPVIYP